MSDAPQKCEHCKLLGDHESGCVNSVHAVTHRTAVADAMQAALAVLQEHGQPTSAVVDLAAVLAVWVATSSGRSAMEVMLQLARSVDIIHAQYTKHARLADE